MCIRSSSRRPALVLGTFAALIALRLVSDLAFAPLGVALFGGALFGGALFGDALLGDATRIGHADEPQTTATAPTAAVADAEPANTAGPAAPFTPEARIRRPVLALSVDDGRTLLVVNQRCGSVSMVDVETRRVVADFDLGGRLEHAAVHPTRRRILLVDSARHQLIAARYDDRQLRIVDRLSVGPWPQSVVINAAGTQAYVASSWSHRLESIELLGDKANDADRAADRASKRSADRSADRRDDNDNVFVESDRPTTNDRQKTDDRRTIDLPFAARAQLLLPDQRHLIVADAFGGSLALIDVERFQLLGVRETTGHNQRAIRLSDDRAEVWIAEQVASPQTPLTEENVAAGRVIRNIVRRIAVTDLLSPRTDLDQASRELLLDEPENGAGDPADVIFDSAGNAAVALSGVRQVAFVSRADWQRDAAQDAVQVTGHNNAQPSQSKSAIPPPSQSKPHAQTVAPNVSRASVGMRPVALTAIPERHLLVAVNSHDDSLTFVDSRRRVSVATIPLGPPARQLPRDRGERSFFDATQSARGHFSCHSCHTDGHTNGRLADTQGDDSFGTPKRTLTLLGTGLTYRWAWNGQQPNLHDQVHKSLEQTLHTRAIAVSQVTDAVAFLHSLPPPPPLAPRTDEPLDRVSLERGRAVFQRLDCGRCHIPPLVYSSNEAYDVGLSDERGLRKFNPPSLRGVAQNSRFFHDNRAGSLEAVFTEFAHPGETQLSPADLRDLLRFLRSL